MYKTIGLLVIVTILLSVFPGSLCCFAQEVQAEKNIIPVKASPTVELNKKLDNNVTWREWLVTVIGFIIAGFIFLLLEITIIPGFGVAGFIGIALLLIGITVSFFKLSLKLTLIAGFVSLLGVIFLILWFVYIFPKTSMGKKFILQADASAEDGFVAVRDLSVYVGKEGIAVSMLRPSGVAKIDGERIDVITDCEYIDKGTKIKVVKEKAGRLIVAPLEDES